MLKLDHIEMYDLRLFADALKAVMASIETAATREDFKETLKLVERELIRRVAAK